MKTLITSCLLIFLLSSCINPPGTKQPQPGAEKDTTKEITVGVKDTLHTSMFDVSLRRYWILDWVNTHNEYTDLKPEANIKYLILNLKYKNTDNESRMIGIGQIFIMFNNKGYNFDHVETIAVDGFSTGVETLNPLTSKTIVFVYKIPKELKGTAYYHPSRDDDKNYIVFEIK